MKRSEKALDILEIFNKLLSRNDLTLQHKLLDEGISSIQAVAAAMLLRSQGIILEPSQILTKNDIATIIKSKQLSSTSIISTNARFNLNFNFTPTQLSWQADGFKNHYNVYAGWEFQAKQINLEVLNSAIKKLCNEQEELKLRIYYDGKVLRQKIVNDPECNGLELIDLTDKPKIKRIDAMCEITKKSQHSFTFSLNQPLYRFIAFILNEDGSGLIFILVHHYLADGFGFNVLIKKLSERYNEILDPSLQSYTKIGSGSARKWSNQLTQYAQTKAMHEIDFWKQLPWDEINKGLITDYQLGHTKNNNLFNEKGAQLLHEYQHGKQFTIDELHKIFSSQATVIEYLDEDATDILMNNNWKRYSFNDFDLFAYAISQALRKYIRGKVIWLDMISAARSGIFEGLDLSSSLGYISELVPFLIYLENQDDYVSGATRIRSFLNSLPHGGIGLRALKYLNPDNNFKHIISDMSLPDIGINYSASLQHKVSNNLLNLKPSSYWFGQTLDENGIRYKFWFRIYYNNKKLEILMRYDPNFYSLYTALAIVAKIKLLMRDYVTDITCKKLT